LTPEARNVLQILQMNFCSLKSIIYKYINKENEVNLMY
jgi:hypothetical protein